MAQAHAVNQPPDTPIYFGMDFEYADKKSPALDKGIIDYFRAVRKELEKPENRFLVGAYGSGKMLAFLLGQDPKSNSEKLIDFAWISPSAGYAGTPEFTRAGSWNVLQAISDSKVSFTPAGVCVDFEFDGDIQNKASSYDYAGAWNRSGRFVLPTDRTAAIYDRHGYICAPRDVKPGVLLGSCAAKKTPAKCDDAKNTGFCSARIVDIKPAANGGYAIDSFGHGLFDGVAPSGALSLPLTNRPHYSKNPSKSTCE